MTKAEEGNSSKMANTLNNWQLLNHSWESGQCQLGSTKTLGRMTVTTAGAPAGRGTS